MINRRGDASKQAGAGALFWLIAVLSLAWNGYAAYDFVMTGVRDSDHLAGISAEAIQAIDAFPYWVLAAWAVGVGGAVVGSLLLLMRWRLARLAFTGSLLGLAGLTFYRVDSQGAGAVIDGVTVAIWIVAILLLLLSHRWCRNGVLRQLRR